MNIDSVVNYIISYLIGEEDPLMWAYHVSEGKHMSNDNANHVKYDQIKKLIGYTDDPREMCKYRIVIKPSGFFDDNVYGTERSHPKLPLKKWRESPLLFGSPIEEDLMFYGQKTKYIHADIIASSYYLISRYEEMTNRSERDELGRFLGKTSLAFKANFIHRPVVDEYRVRLCQILEEMNVNVPNYNEQFSFVHLTHDVDQPYCWRGIRGFVRSLIEQPLFPLKIKQSISRAFGSVENDPYFTFKRFLHWNNDIFKDIERTTLCQSVLFLKTPGKHPKDKPNYKITDRAIRKIVELGEQAHAKFGLHVNITAAKDKELIIRQKKYLEKTLDKSIIASRHHYLAVNQPEDFLELINAGINHDFTMGYPDMVGFRLGTCRPVRFINPNNCMVTDLILHPLPIMDYTLHDKKYMGLDYSQAFDICTELININYDYGGELTLLFHNENLSKQSSTYHTKLYRNLLRQVRNLAKEAKKEIVVI